MKTLVAMISTVIASCGYDATYYEGTTCSTGVCPGELECCNGVCASGTCVDSSLPACMNVSDPIIDLALNQPAQADTEIDSPGARAQNANDGSDGSRWSAPDGTPGHWWLVDLGSDRLLDSINTLWELDGVNFTFYVSTSSDGMTFTTAINNTADTRTVRARTDMFPSGTCARYVRITKTDTTGWWAILYTVNVMGR